MKVDRRRPTDAHPTLMNARRREKKQQLWMSHKPKLKSEWTALSELLISWAKTSDSISIDDFAVQHNYGIHRLAKWVADSEEFAEAWEIATQQVLQRRNKVWRDADKLLSRTLTLYDWRLRDLEDEKEKQKNEAILSTKQSIIYMGPQVSETEEGKEYKQKKKDKK